MEERSFHPLPSDNGNAGIERSLRDMPPAHYGIKIESFSALSKLLQDAKVPNYESEVFESSGFKWKLSLYPKGNEEDNGQGHISLYLVIAETDKLPVGWEAHVNFKLFVYDQIQDKYLCFQDANGKVRRFNYMKTQWGFSQLLPLCSFKDANNGYLVNDKCAFGAEVFVIKYSGRWESVAVLEGLDETYTWKIEKFSSLMKDVYYSDVFTLGEQKWKLELHPKGDSRSDGKSLSLFIELADKDSFPCDRKIFAKYMLRVKDQCHGNHEDLDGTDCFNSSDYSWGTISMMPLAYLRDASAGFLVNDTLIIEAKVECLSSTAKN